MNITTKQIKELRDKTKSSIADCKEALEKAAGDSKKAKKLLIEKGAAILEKKAGRSTKNGIIVSYIHSDKRIGALVQLVCETDFVAKTEDFQNLAKELTLQIAATDPEDVKGLMAQPYIRDESMTVADLFKSTVSKLKENIKLEKFCRYQI